VSSSSSAATTTFALLGAGSSCGGSTEASGAAAVASADCALDSTLSSRPCTGAATVAGAAAAMPPPCLRGAKQPQQGANACRKQQRWQLEQAGCEHEDVDDLATSPRPGKLQRTLSICRTKSVPAGLDQVLLDAAVSAAAADAAGTAGGAVGALQAANSC
jgi:hypothetical protein